MKTVKKLFVFILAIIFLVSCTKKVNDETKPEDKKYFSKLTHEGKFAKDPNVPENIIEVTNTVVKVKVLSKGESDYYFKELPFPHTRYEVELKEVILGKVDKLTEVYNSGGDVRLDKYIEYVKTTEASDISKMGLDKATEEQMKNEYVKNSFEYSYDLVQGKEYILVISQDGRIVDNGYGIFENNNENFTNVISKKDFPKNILSK